MPDASAGAQFFACKESFSGMLGNKGQDGEITCLAGQTILPADHPAVKKWPQFFQAITAQMSS